MKNKKCEDCPLPQTLGASCHRKGTASCWKNEVNKPYKDHAGEVYGALLELLHAVESGGSVPAITVNRARRVVGKVVTRTKKRRNW